NYSCSPREVRGHSSFQNWILIFLSDSIQTHEFEFLLHFLQRREGLMHVSLEDCDEGREVRRRCWTMFIYLDRCLGYTLLRRIRTIVDELGFTAGDIMTP